MVGLRHVETTFFEGQLWQPGMALEADPIVAHCRRHGRQAAGAVHGRAREAAGRHHRVHAGAFHTNFEAELRPLDLSTPWGHVASVRQG